jgi:hypothetical protein
MYLSSWAYEWLGSTEEQNLDFGEDFRGQISHLNPNQVKTILDASRHHQRVKISLNHPDMNCQMLGNSDRWVHPGSWTICGPFWVYLI